MASNWTVYTIEEPIEEVPSIAPRCAVNNRQHLKTFDNMYLIKANGGGIAVDDFLLKIMESNTAQNEEQIAEFEKFSKTFEEFEKQMNEMSGQPAEEELFGRPFRV